MTLKNIGGALVFAIVVLVAANFVSEMRRTHDGDYGRLFGHEIRKAEPVVPQKIEVVQEAPAIADHTAADPLLLAPAAREEQYLATGAPATPQPVAAAAVPQPQTNTQPEHGPVAIVGDENGVASVGAHRVLSGGFGR